MARTTTMTRKGQVTIPKAVRDQLGLKPFDKVEIVVEGGEARLRRVRLSLDEMAGMLPALGVPIEEMSAIAREEWVERFTDRQR